MKKILALGLLSLSLIIFPALMPKAPDRFTDVEEWAESLKTLTQHLMSGDTSSQSFKDAWIDYIYKNENIQLYSEEDVRQEVSSQTRLPVKCTDCLITYNNNLTAWYNHCQGGSEGITDGTVSCPPNPFIVQQFNSCWNFWQCGLGWW